MDSMDTDSEHSERPSRGSSKHENSIERQSSDGQRETSVSSESARCTRRTLNNSTLDGKTDSTLWK